MVSRMYLEDDERPQLEEDIEYRTINLDTESQVEQQKQKLRGLEISHAVSSRKENFFRVLEHTIALGELDHLSLVSSSIDDSDLIRIFNFLH